MRHLLFIYGSTNQMLLETRTYQVQLCSRAVKSVAEMNKCELLKRGIELPYCGQNCSNAEHSHFRAKFRCLVHRVVLLERKLNSLIDEGHRFSRPDSMSQKFTSCVTSKLQLYLQYFLACVIRIQLSYRKPQSPFCILRDVFYINCVISKLKKFKMKKI